MSLETTNSEDLTPTFSAYTIPGPLIKSLVVNSVTGGYHHVIALHPGWDEDEDLVALLRDWTEVVPPDENPPNG